MIVYVFSIASALDVDTVKNLILRQKEPYDIIIYYKMDTQSIKKFVETELKMDTETLNDFKQKCLNVSSFPLFDVKGNRYAAIDAEVAQFKNTQIVGELKNINAIVPTADKYIRDSGNEDWINRWEQFKGPPFIFTGLLGALMLKECDKGINMEQKIKVFIIHGLPRTYGYYFKTWRYEEVELLWLWNNHVEYHEHMTCKGWEDFDLWTRLNIFNLDYKYHPKIQFKKCENASNLLKLCLGKNETNWAIEKIESMNDLFSDKMVYNIVSLSAILRREVYIHTTYIHTYIKHTYIHTYNIHTYIHKTHIQNIDVFWFGLGVNLKLLWKTTFFHLHKKLMIAATAVKMEYLIKWHKHNKHPSTLKRFFNFLNMYVGTTHTFSGDVHQKLLLICAVARHGVDIFELFSCLYQERNSHEWDCLIAAIMYENMKDQCFKQYGLFDNTMDGIDWFKLFRGKDIANLCGKNSKRIHSMLLQFTHSVVPWLSLSYSPKMKFEDGTMDDFQLHGGRHWQGLFIIPNLDFIPEDSKVYLCFFFYGFCFFFCFFLFFLCFIHIYTHCLPKNIETNECWHNEI